MSLIGDLIRGFGDQSKQAFVVQRAWFYALWDEEKGDFKKPTKKELGTVTSELAKAFGFSQRRVQQLLKQAREESNEAFALYLKRKDITAAEHLRALHSEFDTPAGCRDCGAATEWLLCATCADLRELESEKADWKRLYIEERKARECADARVLELQERVAQLEGLKTRHAAEALFPDYGRSQATTRHRSSSP